MANLKDRSRPSTSPDPDWVRILTDRGAIPRPVPAVIDTTHGIPLNADVRSTTGMARCATPPIAAHRKQNQPAGGPVAEVQPRPFVLDGSDED